MPRVHECNHLGCHEVVTYPNKFCTKHAQEHFDNWTKSINREDKLLSQQRYNHDRRDQEANAFYHSMQWTRTRDFVKQRDMMCSGLSGRMLNDHDYIVDHIVPRRLCSNPFDVNNLWLLSRQEHNRKTKYEEKLPDKVLINLSKQDWIHKLSINRIYKK